jgi:cell division protein FtsQ
VAKNDIQASRATALAQDEAVEQFYRPVAVSKARAYASQEKEAPRSSARLAPQRLEDPGDDREEDAFLRARRRVPVRRGMIPKSTAGRIVLISSVVLGLAAFVLLALGVRKFLNNDPRFRIDSASSIQIMGNSQVTRPELLSVFGSDIGRNIFFVPLAERRAALEELPWVERATVMRLLPNQLRVSIAERTPVAFYRNGNTVGLVDAYGVLLNMPPAMMAVKHYSFPVVAGISEKDPLTVRAARMRFYQQFIHDIDSGSTNVSQQLSEVDISDPEDVRALLPAQGSDILVHFGDSEFLTRYQRYQQHLAEWQRQYPHLASVDLRYDNQVVLEMAKGAGNDANADGIANTDSPSHASLKAKASAARPAAHAAAKQVQRWNKSPKGTAHSHAHNLERKQE